jgi:hypothetical protein
MHLQEVVTVMALALTMSPPAASPSSSETAFASPLKAWMALALIVLLPLVFFPILAARQPL